MTSTVHDAKARDRAIARFRELGVRLPTFAELRDPSTIPAAVRAACASAGPDDPSPQNLFRVHWYNDAARTGVVDIPEHLVLPRSLTGVDARIVVLLGNRFPLIGAHKVLATYGCLAPRLVEGRFDPTRHRAVWPSTGNYCRGGVAISRILGCRGVAVLPEAMSAERFHWLEEWVADPADIIRTPGSESNVKEIYDKCHELAEDESNVILNQFSEFGNYLAHYTCTGPAMERVLDSVGGTPVAFVSASGSGGTLAAGDYLKPRTGCRIVAVEAIECPTLLMNGFGEHNIQGIGDKHVPFIHNVMNTDVVVGITDRATDSLGVLFNTAVGRAYLADRHAVPKSLIEALSDVGLSGICNVLAAIKCAKAFGWGAEETIVTVATDGADLYESERTIALDKRFGGRFDTVAAAECFGRYMLGAETDHVRELTHAERERMFNLGYFTWVEQQGVSIPDFVARKQPAFWTAWHARTDEWDEAIRAVNVDSGASA